MTTDHDFDGLYDLRDLQDSDAWFTDAASRSLGTSDPLSPSVVAMLERLDRELSSLAPLDRSTVTALITGLNEPRPTTRAERRTGRGAARHARRNLVVVGVTGALLVAAGGVAAASPGSFLYPVREATLGSVQEQPVPEDLSGAASELNRIEVRIGDAQLAGGITESARTALVRRMGDVHAALEQATGDQADALRARWTRDDLVLVALPHLDAPAPATTTSPAPAPTPDTSASTRPTPTASPRQDPGPVTTPSPRSSGQPAPQSSHSSGSEGDGHTSPTPTPSPTRTHEGGDHSPDPTPTSEHSHTPKPSPTPTTGGSDGSGTGSTAGSGTGSTQGKND